MNPTVWKARAVHGDILCGRQVQGRYVCQGQIAFRIQDDYIMMVPGMTEDPAGSGFWRPTARSQRRSATGRQAVAHAASLNPHRQDPAYVETTPLPWRRACPHCGTIAEVTDDLISLSR